MPPSMEIEVIRSGKAQGKLIGGNLSLIASLCGTKWQLHTEGKILLLEDVSEDLYAVDRLLWQLKAAGLLKNPAGVILASWADCETQLKYSKTLEQIFEDYFSDAAYPVIRNFPSGHDIYQATLPLNVMVELDTDLPTVKILESSVSID